NPAINPGAAEICNGIDDNCNGQIDEGNPPANQVYVGNVIFTNQAAVDAFSQCYYKIQGNMTISGPAVNSLANLSNLQEVTGNVLIQATSLPNMNGLDALTTIGASLTIKLNNYGAKLTSLSGLGNLISIGQNLNISFNFSLSDCCSIDDLLANAGVGGSTIIFYNAAGCNSVSDISNSCGGGSIIVLPGNGIAFGETVEQPRMSLFPNPATSEVTVLLEGLDSGEHKLRIIDQLGRVVHRLDLDGSEQVLSLNLAELGMNNGIYLVAVSGSGEPLLKRLVVKR
ncbi:MAG: T9SS C-terminal target domain-containing protein, partial [Gammaproteobacteria bacterium]